ncbi:hypothetical protein PR003_g13550 [Phytophthora rubi]|uniref:Integrase catalytic domain-containing protein n=1 Tax=Phytophthora rubi TaxID=129364 RepID=A0A6A4EX69_9STRA|nr:hypothetical protein PR001_g10857 [Phytophthora rubi]KAE9334380.1 hypothetical protein PR003_g13550 [Phytophthora rubi]
MFQCFLDYKADVETKHNRSIRRFISDNGGEYLDGEFTNYCREQGIQRETTIAYTPEQNGMAELWGEAMLAMVYTYNRTLATGIGMTPYELWHGQPPDVSNLRTFGSLAYV